MSSRIAVLSLVALTLLIGQPAVLEARPPGASCQPCHLPAPWTMPSAPQASTLQDGDESLPYVPGRLLVRFAAGTTPEAQERIHAEYGARVVDEIPQLGVQVLQLDDETLVAASAYQTRPEIVYAEPDYVASIDGAPDAIQPVLQTSPSSVLQTPNDPLFSQQWHHATIHAADAWDYVHGDGVKIAIVDTGVNCAHSDLAANCVAGRDVVNNDDDPMDDHGHGTHVAGIASATVNNGVGVAGVGWGAKIMPVKALGSNGSGGQATIANGIVWAVDHGADIINMSLGGFYSSSTLRNAVAYAISHDVVVVSAAGNDNSSNPTYPTAYPGVIGVSATTQSDGRASFSNYGDYIDVAAPGVGILSTVMSGGYQAWSGTSMASPIVAGTAALLKKQTSSRTPAQIEQLLESTAEDLGATGWDPLFGWGRIDAGRALAVGAETGATPVPTPTQPSIPIGTPTATPTPSEDWVQQVEDLINLERRGAGLAPLYTNSALRAAAARHVGDMASGGFCGHGGSDGSSPFDRMRDAGYLSPYGEIVACGQTSPSAVVQAWMGSAPHKDIILCTTCTEIGAGFQRSGSIFEYYWAVDFGTGAVSGPTPTAAQPPTPGTGPTATTTAVPPTATPTPTPVGIPVEVVLSPSCDRVGWVVSSQTSSNHFGDEDTYTGTWNSQLYHGAMQFDVDDIPDDAHLNFARLELTGRNGEFIGSSGAWSVKLLATEVDANFANHGYTTIHNATVEWMLLPVLIAGDLGEARTNTFSFNDAQLLALHSRMTGTDQLSIRLDGPTTGESSNLFTWDSGCGPDSTYPGPKLVVSYSMATATPGPTGTATDTPTEGPTLAPTETVEPTTPTATPTAAETFTPTPTATPAGGGTVELVPLCTDVGWAAQGQSTNHFGDDSIYSGYYHGLAYVGAVQFDLSGIPEGSGVLDAELILTGQSTTFLSKEGNGLWRVRLLKPSADGGWQSHTYAVLTAADSIAQLGEETRQADLGVGVRNRYAFDQELRWALEERLNGSRKISFRIDGPRIGLSNVADWDSGCGAGERYPPILRITFGPPGSGEPTPTEPPENLAKAVAMIDALNQERVKAGLDPLAMSDPLMRAASVHNHDMVKNRFFSNIGSDGSTPEIRVGREGFQAAQVGQAIAGGTSDAFAVVAAWMGRAQKDLILTSEYTHVGAHYMYSRQTAYGHYWTVVFAQAETSP